MTDKKPTLDERLEALTHSLELMQIEQQRLDERERHAHQALLTGIAAYLRALANGRDEESA